MQTPAPADVILQFEGSGRWPDDLVAIQRTKIAFLLKINDMLQEMLYLVDVHGILRRPTWDGVKLLLLLLPLTQGSLFPILLRLYSLTTLSEIQTPIERLVRGTYTASWAVPILTPHTGNA